MSTREEQLDFVGRLQGIKTGQLDLRRMLARDKPNLGAVALAVMMTARRYWALPEQLARRLTEIPPALMQRAQGPLDAGLENAKNRQELLTIAQAIAGDDALAQVIRAANHYRTALGWEPMGPDGWGPRKKPKEEPT